MALMPTLLPKTQFKHPHPGMPWSSAPPELYANGHLSLEEIKLTPHPFPDEKNNLFYKRSLSHSYPNLPFQFNQKNKAIFNLIYANLAEFQIWNMS